MYVGVHDLDLGGMITFSTRVNKDLTKLNAGISSIIMEVLSSNHQIWLWLEFAYH